MNKLNKIELSLTPITRKLLENYVSYEYQENADLTEDSLKTELIYLHSEGLLELLFISEWVYSRPK